MSAVPKYRRLKTVLTDDVKHGAPLEMLTLEADECVTWSDEEGHGELFAEHWLDALSDLWAKDANPKTRTRFDALTCRLMRGTMTPDELIEWRDIQRAAAIDYFSAWARREIEQELPL